MRMVVAASGGDLLVHGGRQLGGGFAAQSGAVLLYGLMTAASVAGGAWFGFAGEAGCYHAPQVTFDDFLARPAVC